MTRVKLRRCASAVLMLSWLGAKGCSLGGNVSLGDPYASGGSDSAGASTAGGDGTLSMGGAPTGGRISSSGGTTSGGRSSSTGGGDSTTFGGDTAAGGDPGDSGGDSGIGGRSSGGAGTGGEVAPNTGGIAGKASTGGAQSGGANTGGAATGGALTGGTGGSAPLIPDGTFNVEFYEAQPDVGSPGYTRFLGVVYDRPPPPNIQLKLDSEQGGCRLMVPVNPHCTKSCGAAGVCTDDEVCTPYGKVQNVGTVRVTGLGPTQLVLEPTPPSYNYQPSTTLPFPACSEGDTVTVQTNNFRLQAKCVAPLALGGPDPIPVIAGKSVSLNWTPPAEPGISRIEVRLDIAHHGGKKGEIDCDVPDTGSFQIPEPLVTKLVGLGRAGFPTILVRRVARDYVTAPKVIQLTIASPIERPVDTGVTSCTAIDECPPGQICHADLTCG